MVARELLGAMLISDVGGEVVAGVVVETEAYLGYDDPASHAYLGRRHAGNLGVYSPPGHWYVYRSYGIHWCANVVTGHPANGAAVLLRATVIDTGREIAGRRRGGVAGRDLSGGPGKLCQAFAIDRSLDGLPIADSPVRLLMPTAEPEEIRVTPRIGITKAADWQLRFVTGEKKKGRR